MIELNLFEKILNNKLKPWDFNNDYCPNGLQVQGIDEVNKVALGVSASLEFIEKCADANFDTMVVHHGLFWNYQDRIITKLQKKRLEVIMKNDMNLFAYHLPLDCHPDFGNNVSLLRKLKFPVSSFIGQNDGIVISDISGLNINDIELVAHIQNTLLRIPTVVYPKNSKKTKISKIAVCTGSAGMYFESLLYSDIDAFITGEISEQHYHMANEADVMYIAAGHHATETYGPIELGRHIYSVLKNIEAVEFIDVFNPI